MLTTTKRLGRCHSLPIDDNNDDNSSSECFNDLESLYKENISVIVAGLAVAAIYTGGKSSAAGTALTSVLGKGNMYSTGNTSAATGLIR